MSFVKYCALKIPFLYPGNLSATRIVGSSQVLTVQASHHTNEDVDEMASTVSSPFEVDQQTCIGSSLMNAFNEFISEKKVKPELAVKIVRHFDRIFAEIIKANAKGTISFKAFEHSHFTYRSREETWTLSLEKVEIKLEDGEKLHAEKVQIAMTSSAPT